MNSRQEVEWPDWRGETAVIVATGPSAAMATLSAAKGLARFIVIKTSWQLAPWADVLYGCDRRWWVEHDGLPEFDGLKLTASPLAARFPGVRSVRLVKTESILTDEIGTIGCGSRTGGGHSGFHALNLAVQFGATRIVLLGFDMSNGHPDTAVHRMALDRAVMQLDGFGVSVAL